ncbi:MAG: HAD family hydrolase, partial [Microcystaceae cyanobacterium]
YQYCLSQIQSPEQDVTVLSKENFWELKRSQVPERQIGLLSGLHPEQAQRFAQLRRSTVHTLPYLSYDQPLPGAVDTLEKLQSLDIDLVVMTMRRVRELDEALERNQLGHFFSPSRRYCLSNDYVKTGDTKDKPLLMARAVRELPAVENIWMVGDTEADILAAQSQNIPVIGVLSGIRDRQRLEACKPTHIVANLDEAVNWILAKQN